LMYSKMN